MNSLAQKYGDKGLKALHNSLICHLALTYKADFILMFNIYGFQNLFFVHGENNSTIFRTDQP